MIFLKIEKFWFYGHDLKHNNFSFNFREIRVDNFTSSSVYNYCLWNPIDPCKQNKTTTKKPA